MGGKGPGLRNAAECRQQSPENSAVGMWHSTASHHSSGRNGMGTLRIVCYVVGICGKVQAVVWYSK